MSLGVDDLGVEPLGGGGGAAAAPSAGATGAHTAGATAAGKVGKATTGTAAHTAGATTAAKVGKAASGTGAHTAGASASGAAVSGLNASATGVHTAGASETHQYGATKAATAAHTANATGAGHVGKSASATGAHTAGATAVGSVTATPEVDVTVSGTGTGTVGLASEEVDFTPDFQVTILDPTIWRAPSSITVVVDGGRPGIDITFYLDNDTSGQDIAYVATLDSSGGLDPTSISILDGLGGQQGDRTLTATQPASDGGTLTATATYHVTRPPQAIPTIQGPDADPIELTEAVINGIRHWVLQDLLAEEDGGVGSYVMPINPSQMSSPHLEFAISSHHTTAHSGMFHLFQAGNIPKEWSFSGVADTPEFVAELEQYFGLNRRFYLIDHHNRAWKVVFTNLEIVPRLRTNWMGQETDWFTDYTVTATVVNQTWSTPV